MFFIVFAVMLATDVDLGFVDVFGGGSDCVCASVDVPLFVVRFADGHVGQAAGAIQCG
jgi:hypothetical protein